MKYSAAIKFLAVFLCAAALLGAVSSGAGLLALTELGGKSVEQAYRNQLENCAVSYARLVGSDILSKTLGNADDRMLEQENGSNRRDRYLSWDRTAYVLYDGEGNPVQEQEMPLGAPVAYEFRIPVQGTYLKVLGTMPREEYDRMQQDSQSQPAAQTQVLVMPAQDSTVIGGVFVTYTDGSRTDWPADGTQLGGLYRIDGTLTFHSNFGSIPEGDGWYVSHILMQDMGGNTVYEAKGENGVILASQLEDSGSYRYQLPAGALTASAPVGITYTDGDFTSYDAVPDQGITVTSMNVTYANAQGEAVGSEGIVSPDLIGTLFHDPWGNIQFHSTDPMPLDLPADCLISHIAFSDGQSNLIYEASCPGGVGRLEYDEKGYLIFRGSMPGTESGQQADAEETAEAAPAGSTGIVQAGTGIYSAPDTQGELLGMLAAGDTVTILTQATFAAAEGPKRWALIGESQWVLMEDIVLPEQLPPEETAAEAQLQSRMAAAVPVEESGPAPEETTVPPAQAETAAAAAEETLPVSREDVPATAESAEYLHYHDETQSRMTASYVMMPIPEGYTMHIRLAEGAMGNELSWVLLRVAEALCHWLLEALGICLGLFVICGTYLCCAAGRKGNSGTVCAGGLNRLPLDLYLGAAGFGGTALAAAAIAGGRYLVKNDGQLALVFTGGCAYLICLLTLGFFFAMVAQFKTPGGFWWRNSLVGRCIRLTKRGFAAGAGLSVALWKRGRPLWKTLRKALRKTLTRLYAAGKRLALWIWDTAKRLGIWAWHTTKKWTGWTAKRFARLFGLLPITWQFLTTGFALVLMLYIMMRTYKVGYILLGFGIFFAVILYAASAFAILLESAKKMSKGDLDTKVDDRMLVGGFKDFAGELNNLAGVAVVAAQKQLKSERMKTELITNVSHDIKTPLTSIINYVDLLQKPHTPQQQEQYLEVLQRQSQRLKKLVDDLMEMSKASTGNMSVDIQRMDAGETVNQVLGEFADKLERARLTPVFRQPEEPVEMMADGKLVWRIMSNILGNAVKYALPGTRIYLDLMKLEGKVILSVKNISREELNVNAEELMERFVRGDASRNTEGSGLGLNIAQSLMQLQKGQLQVLVDGDLFKVTLIFPGA